MSLSDGITSILFDLGGTLDADGIPWRQRFHDLYRQEGLALSEDEFAPHFYAADDPLVGALPAEMGLGATVARLTEALEQRLPPGDPGRGERVAQAFLRDANARLARNRAALAVLADRFRLGIVSNFYGNLEGVCAEASLLDLVDVAIDSAVIGVEKPDRKIFLAALEAMEATPERCLFVGDSLRRDKAGADALGMRFVWVAPEEAQRAAPENGFPVIAAVPELCDLLAA
ncbi:MAG: HAD family hydrolase [Alphaproteobacteria bacterium]|nr:HAD family hydrolase [Alphaproteobacteria bacterium]